MASTGNFGTSAVLTADGSTVSLSVAGLTSGDVASKDNGTAILSSALGVINLTAGTVYGNIYINGVAEYNVGSQLGKETATLPNITGTWPDAVINGNLEDVVWSARRGDTSGVVVDARYYLPLAKEGGVTNNWSESKLIEKDTNYAVFGGENYWGNGTDTWNAIGIEDILNWYPFNYNMCHRFNSTCNVIDILAYPTTHVFDEDDYIKLEKWRTRYGDCGQNPLEIVTDEGEAVTDGGELVLD